VASLEQFYRAMRTDLIYIVCEINFFIRDVSIPNITGNLAMFMFTVP
jgi:hypothetical protein